MQNLNHSRSYFLRDNNWLLPLCLLLLIPSYFINLGIFPLYNEEPRRALIALEMIFRNNFLVPTQMGEFYYKKPPVFNWLLIGSFELFGSYSEFAARFVSVISLLGMGVLIFLFVKKWTNIQLAVYSSLLFLVSADIYFYFSLTSEIDLFYSFITFGSIIAVFHFHKKSKLLTLFLTAYGLGAIGFLTKGLPSAVFLAITISVFFFYKKEFKKLFSRQHFAGIGLFLLIVGGYFWLYSTQNSLEGFVRDLWTQSSDRTLVKKSILDLTKHLYTFPIVVLKDTLPASILLIFAFNRSVWKKIFSNDLMKFCAIIFLANILIYWISPGTRSRYIYMLYPFLIVIFTFIFLENKAHYPRLVKFLEGLGIFIFGVLAIAGVGVLFVPEISAKMEGWGYSIILTLTALLLLFLFIKNRKHVLLWIILAFIVARIGFDIIVLPVRAAEGEHVQFKKDAEIITNIAKGDQLYLWQHQTDGTYSLGSVFYIERERKEVLAMKHEKNCTSFFLADTRQLQNDAFKVYHAFSFRGNNYYLFKFTDCNN